MWFTRPHKLLTDSGATGPSWNHVSWRDSQMNPGASFTGRMAYRVDASCLSPTGRHIRMINTDLQRIETVHVRLRSRKHSRRSSHWRVGLKVLSLKTDVPLAALVTLSLGFFVCKMCVAGNEQKITRASCPVLQRTARIKLVGFQYQIFAGDTL